MKSSNPSTKTRDAVRCAPQIVTHVASKLAEQLYDEVLRDIKIPPDHKLVPEVTVTVGYRFDKE